MSKDSLPFITKELDDSGLPLVAFRVLCRALRRAGRDGECWESVPSIAKACHVNVKTARKALRTLVNRKFLTAKPRAGGTTVFVVNPTDQWQPYPIEYPTQRNTQVSKRRKGLPKAIPGGLPNGVPTHPTQRNTHKGSPIEVTPKKGGQEGDPAPTTFNGHLYPGEALRIKEQCSEALKTIMSRDSLRYNSFRDQNGELTPQAELEVKALQARIAHCNEAIIGQEGIQSKALSGLQGKTNPRNAGIAADPQELGRRRAEFIRNAQKRRYKEPNI